MRRRLGLSILFLAAACQAELIGGQVVKVIDGDTITVLDAGKVQHKVRLTGIDAPEKSQAFGQKSRASLAELVAGRTVIVETYKMDRHGRPIGKVLLNGQDVNIKQIRRGMAWYYRDYKRGLSASDKQSYDRAESNARAFRKGFWWIRVRCRHGSIGVPTGSDKNHCLEGTQ